MFKLNIECTKDISFLKINFTDGTNTVVENKSPKETKKGSKNYMDSTLPTDDKFDYTSSSQNVKLPDLPDIKRPVKVADELQNLNI